MQENPSTDSTFFHKTLMKVKNSRKLHNIIKAIYNKPIANIILNGKNIETITSKVRNKKGSTLSTLIQQSWNF
jgi:hypothetical protein